MISLWWRQIQSVIRLEMKKTFFAKRGLWVYLLALAPSLIWLGHSINTIQNAEQRRALATAHPVNSVAMHSVTIGMDLEEVTKTLGEPYARNELFRPRGPAQGPVRNQVERLSYTDGESDMRITAIDGVVRGIRLQDRCNISKDSLVFATVFQFFYLRLAVFFGCVGIFMNLFRGEMIDKSLHFYLLAPIRREVLLVGKFLAGLVATTVIFTSGTALQFLALSWHYDPGAVGAFLQGSGWNQIGAYLGVTALACLGYGSVFLAAGLLFRNPLIPAAVVLLWEAANLFLPVKLKKISVIFYLQSLCPVVAPPQDMPALLRLLISSAEAPSAMVSIFGLLAVTAVVLVVASLKARKLEINYSTD